MRSRFSPSGFTLVELLVSTAVLSLLLVLLVQSVGQTSDVLRYSTSKIEEFREARMGFESITRRLSQATLNTYWDYDNPQLPTRYERRSELRFTSGQADALLGTQNLSDGYKATRLTQCVFFHAPLGVSSAVATNSDPAFRGLENLLNVWGYYVEFGDDSTLRPSFITKTVAPLRWRFRLMEFGLPSENVETYNLTSGLVGALPKASTYSDTTWFTDPLSSTFKTTGRTAMVHAMTENVIALVIIPRLPKREEKDLAPANNPDYSPLAPLYSYDSSPAGASALQNDARYADARTNPINQLPPVVQVTMVAMDETSALRLNLNGTTANPDLSGQADLFGIKAKSQFQDTKKYTSDLLLDPTKTLDSDVSLEATLIKMKVNYRIFTSNVSIRSAKWSRDQVK